MGTMHLPIFTCGALDEHYSAIDAIAEDCLFGEDLERHERNRESTCSNLRFLVAVKLTGQQKNASGPVRGFITLRLHTEFISVSNIAVPYDYRRLGVGSHLLAHAMSGLRNRKSVQLSVELFNLPAIELAESCGFSHTGTYRVRGLRDRFVFEYRRGLEDVAMAARSV